MCGRYGLSFTLFIPTVSDKASWGAPGKVSIRRSRQGDGSVLGGGVPTTAPRCALSVSISAASSTEANSSVRFATMAEMVIWREAARADVAEQVGIGEGTILWRLQRPNVERHRCSAARGYDPIDQELGGRHVCSGRASYREWTGPLLRSHGSLKSARLRRKSEATSSTLPPCKSTAAVRAAIVSLLSWPDSFSKGALICGNRSKVVLRTTGASM